MGRNGVFEIFSEHIMNTSIANVSSSQSFAIDPKDHASVTDLALRMNHSLWVDHPITNAIGAQAGLAFSLAMEWQRYGFECEAQLLTAMTNMSVDRLVRMNNQVSKVLAKMVGAHRVWDPLFPNFPVDALNSPNTQFATALLRALRRDAFFWINWDVLPVALVLSQKQSRAALNETMVRRQLRLIDTDGLGQLLVRHLQMSTPWAPQMRTDVLALVSKIGGAPSLAKYMTQYVVTNKENLAYVGSYLVSAGENISCLKGSVSSVTDVLRILVALSASDADVSLAKDSKLRIAKVSRANRRGFLTLMEQLSDSNQVLENMRTRRGLFLKVGEMLHPSEYREQYPKTAAVYLALRNPKMAGIHQYGSLLEKAMLGSNVNEAIGLLSQRPGVFARRVVALLRLASSAQTRLIVSKFHDVAGQVSAPVLWQLRTHVERGMDKTSRVFSIKGSMAKLFVRKNIEALSDELRLSLLKVIDDALMAKYADLPALGKVYMAKDLRKIAAPHGLRNSTEGLLTIPRGSVIPLYAQGQQGEKPWVRFFMWWKGDYIDLDLSVVLLRADGSVARHCSWTDLRSNGMVHSGDVRSAPNGACEFIDVHMDSIKDARYMVLVVNSYSGIDFSTLEESFAGWMLRDGPAQIPKNSYGYYGGAYEGEAFDARTVAHKIDLTGATKVAVPMIVDLQQKEVIWIDGALKNARGLYTTEHQHTFFYWLFQAATNMERATLGDVMDLHVRARNGVYVDSPEDADLVVDWNGTLRPFDNAQWSSQWIRD